MRNGSAKRCSRTYSLTTRPRTCTWQSSALSAAQSEPHCSSGVRGNVISALPEMTLHLSTILRSPLLDRAGERLGRVEDLIVRLADGGYPPVPGLKARIGGRDLFVPADRIATLEPGAVRLSGETLSHGRFERRVGEVLLGQDVLGRKLVNVEADPPSLVTAHEIELKCIDGWWRVVGVDHSSSAQLRRLLPRPFKRTVADRPFLDWTDLEPFV